jgi:hypothetical protein
MEKATVKIIAANVDQYNLTMYKADGTTIKIPQGDPRIRPLVEKVIPAIEANKFALLVQEDLTLVSHYGEAEKQLGGVAKFFRIVKTKVKEIVDKFSTNTVEPFGMVGEVPDPTVTLDVTPVAKVEEDEDDNLKSMPLTKSMAAVEEILRHSSKTSDAAFHTPDTPGEETTVVAVLEDGTIIPGIEQIDVQFRALVGKLGTVTGMTNFLKRLGSVQHSHSAQDLLKFMEKGELPIADDGCVLVYKRLRRKGDRYVDCHSGRVQQRVGSYVCMDKSLVDANRSRDCSNGLHIARRDYLSSFSGDVCVLAKLAPEDVIAVPHGDARKLRARAYHIIAELSQADHDLVTQNRPMADQVLLGNAIAGNHVGVIERVEITQQYGSGVIITPVEEGHTTPTLEENLKGDSLDHLPEEVSPEGTSVDAKELAKSLAKPVEPVKEEVFTAPPGGVYVCEVDESCGEATPPPAPPVTKKSPVQQLVEAFVDAATPDGKTAAALALVDHKKKVKKSWTALGVPAAVVDAAVARINEHNKPEQKKVNEFFVPVEAKPEKKKQPNPLAGSKLDAKAPAKPKAKPVAKPKTKPAPEGKPVKRTQKEEAAHLLEIYNRNPDKTNARHLVEFKKAAKKSWDVLGVDAKLGKKLEERVKP